MADGLKVLRERVATLDVAPGWPRVAADIDRDLAQFIRVMAPITASGTPGHVARLMADEADAIVAECALLGRLDGRSPELTVGPLRRAQQYWVAVGQPHSRRRRLGSPDKTRFVAATRELVPSTKPFGVGLYTSTGALDTFGMWWCYLQLHAGSTLFPRPWEIWSIDVRPEAVVHEIATAGEWLDLVLSSDPHESGGVLYPNWRVLAERYDAIHMTLRAITATQGLCVSDANAVAAPMYWDVESTFWLRWAFVSTRYVGGRA